MMILIPLTILDIILIYLMIGFIVWVDAIYKYEFEIIRSVMIIPFWPVYLIIGVRGI